MDRIEQSFRTRFPQLPVSRPEHTQWRREWKERAPEEGLTRVAMEIIITRVTKRIGAPLNRAGPRKKSGVEEPKIKETSSSKERITVVVENEGVGGTSILLAIVKTDGPNKFPDPMKGGENGSYRKRLLSKMDQVKAALVRLL